jgi:hypothetical protein
MRLILIFIVLYSVSLKAQSSDSAEVEIARGDTLIIGKTTGENFKYLDMYRKTRWVGNEPAYDTATGDGFFKSFFSTGDFDVAELPKAYSGRKFLVLGVEILQNKNTGQPMNVLYLKGSMPHTVIWVDFDEAMQSGELLLSEE